MTGDDWQPAPPTGVALTPSAFLEPVAARLDRLHEGAPGVLQRAGPVKPSTTGRVYGGFVHAQLRDPYTADAAGLGRRGTRRARLGAERGRGRGGRSGRRLRPPPP